MSVNSKMTALADEIRELSSSEEKMSLDNMIENLNGANTTIQTEAGLINQIINSLATKSGASSKKIQNRYIIPMFVNNRFINDTEFAGICIREYSPNKHDYNILYAIEVFESLELSDVAFCITYNEGQITISEINVNQSGIEILDEPDYDISMSLFLSDIDYETSLVLLKFISRE